MGVLIRHVQTAQAKGPAHWDSVKIALITSIRTGAFFDRKYWARHSNSGDVLKPVYFSSTIMKGKTEQVDKGTSGYISCFTKILNVFSGKILHRSECSHE